MFVAEKTLYLSMRSWSRVVVLGSRGQHIAWWSLIVHAVLQNFSKLAVEDISS